MNVVSECKSAVRTANAVGSGSAFKPRCD